MRTRGPKFRGGRTEEKEPLWGEHLTVLQKEEVCQKKEHAELSGLHVKFRPYINK